jgi:hypothetical protein
MPAPEAQRPDATRVQIHWAMKKMPAPEAQRPDATRIHIHWA